MELILRPCSPVDSAPGTSTDLHLVDVGGVVSEATEGGDGLAAAVWNQPVLRLCRLDVHALQPVPRVVAAAALELSRDRPQRKTRINNAWWHLL